MLSWKNKRSLVVAVGTLILSLTALAQTAQPAKQIGPGTAGSISPAQGVGTQVDDAPKKNLDGALTKQTRQTLLEAMNSVDPASMVAADQPLDIGPGEGVELNGASSTLVDLKQMPASLQDALSSGVQQSLGQSGAR